MDRTRNDALINSLINRESGLMIDQIGELAYLITGNIAAGCCHRGGAFKADNPRCECRAIAEGLIEDKEKVVAILNGTYEPRSVVRADK